MKLRLLILLALLEAPIAYAYITIYKICNDRTCYEQKIDTSRYEWNRSTNGEKYLRVYKPDGTLVDITGRDLKIEIVSEKKKKHK